MGVTWRFDNFLELVHVDGVAAILVKLLKSLALAGISGILSRPERLESQRHNVSLSYIRTGFPKLGVPSWGPYYKGILLYYLGIMLGVPMTWRRQLKASCRGSVGLELLGFTQRHERDVLCSARLLALGIGFRV